MNSETIVALLRERHSDQIFVEELRAGSGYGGDSECHHPYRANSCPHTPDLTPMECGQCCDEAMLAQREEAIRMIPALEENRSTMAVARKLRAIFKLPTKQEVN